MEVHANSKAEKVKDKIASASKKTGADFGFLMATAKRESAFNPKASAKTSSAKGLYQFLDNTWLGIVKKHGAKYGLENYSKMISSDGKGKFSMPSSESKKKLLNLRYDPEVASVMAAELSKDNANYIKARTGVKATPGDLYAAHFLGAAGAASIIKAAKDKPWANAADLFPDAAAANKPVFYKNGKALNVSQVLANLRSTTKNFKMPDDSDMEFADASDDKSGSVKGTKILYDDDNVTLAMIPKNGKNSNLSSEAQSVIASASKQNPLLLAQMYNDGGSYNPSEDESLSYTHASKVDKSNHKNHTNHAANNSHRINYAEYSPDGEYTPASLNVASNDLGVDDETWRKIMTLSKMAPEQYQNS